MRFITKRSSCKLMVICSAILLTVEIYRHGPKTQKEKPADLSSVCRFDSALSDPSQHIGDSLHQAYQSGLVPECVYQLWRKYHGKETELAQRIRHLEMPTNVSRIRTIGIYHKKVYYGGIERVISLYSTLFLNLKYRVVLFTETVQKEKEYPIDERVIRIVIPHDYNKNRTQILARYLKSYRIDILLYENAYAKTLLYDLLVIRGEGIPVVICDHGTVLHHFNDSACNYFREFYHIHRLASKVIVSCRMQEAFLNAIGANALYIPNPIQFQKRNISYDKQENIIMWAGRLNQRDKNYRAALHVMQKLKPLHPDAQLAFLGLSKNDALKEVSDFIVTNHLENNVKLVLNTKDITTWYTRSKVHLVTSPYEAFGMVIAESKAFGIPLVLFDLPYLELLRDGKGYISVKQNDINAAVTAIHHLLSNQTLYLKLAKEAYHSLEPFRRYNQRRAWEGVFEEVTKKLRSRPSQKNAIPREDLEALITNILNEAKKLAS